MLRQKRSAHISLSPSIPCEKKNTDKRQKPAYGECVCVWKELTELFSSNQLSVIQVRFFSLFSVSCMFQVFFLAKKIRFPEIYGRLVSLLYAAKKRRDQLTHFLEWSWAEVKFNFSLSTRYPPLSGPIRAHGQVQCRLVCVCLTRL